ncbi:DUF3459 domain-containing protein [Sphingomonas sp. I4]
MHIAPRLKGTVGVSAEATGPARVKARWRMADGAMLTILIDLGEQAEPLDDEEGTMLYREGDRFAAWITS